MYKARSGVKNFSLYWGGVPLQKIFFPVWICIKPNLVSKNFPFMGGGGPSAKNFFSSVNMYQAKSGVKNFSLYWGGGPSEKIFFPVWTCIKPNLVSKIFPFTRGGSVCEKFFFQSEHVSSQIWCQKFSPLLRVGYPPQLGLEPPLAGTKPSPPPSWDQTPPARTGPPQLGLDLPPFQGWIGDPPSKAGSGPPPPRMWTDWNYYLTLSFGWRAVINKTVYMSQKWMKVRVFVDLKFRPF